MLEKLAKDALGGSKWTEEITWSSTVDTDHMTILAEGLKDLASRLELAEKTLSGLRAKVVMVTEPPNLERFALGERADGDTGD